MYPNVSIDGRCPSCASDDWKLAKVIVSKGTTMVDTESEGGGWGVGVGAGQGHGGVGVNYQGVTLDTKGTLITADAARYAAPQMPEQCNKKSSLFSKIVNSRTSARDAIEKIDEFASNLDAIKPGLFSHVPSDINIEMYRKNYEESISILAPILEISLEYEVEKELWEKTRVCCRCGESFVTDNDKHHASTRKIEKILPYTFEGENRRCPSCKSYVWKTANAFFEIRLRELQANCDTAKNMLESAVNIANKPKKTGFFNQLWNKVEKAINMTPEKAQTMVDDAQAQLNNIIQKRNEALQQHPSIQQNPNFNKVRVCVECEKLYKL